MTTQADLSDVAVAATATPDRSTPAIRTAGLSRRYGEVQAVRDLDLVVPAGAVFGFLGRNGAGKTTTIRLITGLARPDAGQAWIGGVASSNGDGRAAPLFGYLPQEPAFYGWLTAAETLDHAGRLFRIPATERRQQSLVALAEKVEAIVVVGGRESANTRWLHQVAVATGRPAWHVEGAADLPADVGRYRTVGITAGASTPESLIAEVEAALAPL